MLSVAKLTAGVKLSYDCKMAWVHLCWVGLCTQEGLIVFWLRWERSKTVVLKLKFHLLLLASKPRWLQWDACG